MKTLLFFIYFLAISMSGIAQNKDVTVYEKKDGDKVAVIARNTGSIDYIVKVNIDSEGMDVSPSTEVEAVVPAGFMKELATIVPRVGEAWSYGYDVAITPAAPKTTSKPTPSQPSPPKQSASVSSQATLQKAESPNPSLSDANIILYAKPGCGRCTYAKKQLSSLGIEYLEVDTHSSSPEASNMWAQMKAQGFKGGSVTMPVIRVAGAYHYNIKDLEGFIADLK